MPHFGGASEKCSVCSKTVYVAEKIVVEDKEDKKTFHKTCLKCSHCKATLSLGNYASMNGIMYCKPHFKQLFATKGNYDEGFGKEKLTSKWTPNAPAAPTANSFVPVDKTEEPKPVKETPTSIASRFQRSTVNTEKCEKCSKTVYVTEKIVIEEKEGKKVFHKSCLRCTHCQVVLTLGSYAAMNGITYCKPHLKQLFATKGNYDEGFGKERHTTKWEPQTTTAPSTFVPVEKDSPKENKVSTSSDVANKFKGISESNKCDKCGKTVYLTEKIVVEDKEEKKLFHKSCLRCVHCQVVLSLGNYASMDGVTYCKPHFKQLFAAKGNYDEGFGKEKHTSKWIDREDESKEDLYEESHHEEPRHKETHHEERHHDEEPHHEKHHHEDKPHSDDEDREDKHHKHEEPHHEKHHEGRHHEDEEEDELPMEVAVERHDLLVDDD